MFNIFRRKPRIAIEGDVVRVGPWFGHGDINGLVFMVHGYALPFVVLRDGPAPGDYFAGLTREGDRVSFQAVEGEAYHSVSLSTFKNLTLGLPAGEDA